MVIKYKRPDGAGGTRVPPYTREDRAAEADLYARVAGTGPYGKRPMVIIRPAPRSAGPGSASHGN
jgi:hypothetical protein